MLNAGSTVIDLVGLRARYNIHIGVFLVLEMELLCQIV